MVVDGIDPERFREIGQIFPLGFYSVFYLT
jgi:hypothetical protein